MNPPPVFAGRLAVQQRVLPDYRAPFFDRLARACAGGMSLLAGQPRRAEQIHDGELQAGELRRTRNVHLFGGPLYLCHQPGLRAWLQDWNPDALIVEANPRYPATPGAVTWMRERGRPVVGWGLGSPPLSGALSGFRQNRRRAFLRQFDALIAYSRRGADGYAALGYPSEKIFVAHNAVAPRPAWPLPVRPPAFEPRPGLLYVGRLQARKRLDLVLRACAQLSPAPRLVIVGDGPERPALQKLAAEVYPSAEFPGARRGDQLRASFLEADLFVLPGTGGLAVQEAMSYGLPVVVARGDGTQDDLVRAGNGWQVPPDDFQALLAALREALSDVARLRRFGAESYRIVAEEINIERMAEVFVNALEVAG